MNDSERVEQLKKALLECREEFCWHGNTGRSLSRDFYGTLVDRIDRVLHTVCGDEIPS